MQTFHTRNSMRLYNIAASAAAAAAGGGVAGATRAVAVTRSVNFALNDDTVFTVMTANEQSQD